MVIYSKSDVFWGPWNEPQSIWAVEVRRVSPCPSGWHCNLVKGGGRLGAKPWDFCQRKRRNSTRDFPAIDTYQCNAGIHDIHGNGNVNRLSWMVVPGRTVPKSWASVPFSGWLPGNFCNSNYRFRALQSQFHWGGSLGCKKIRKVTLKVWLGKEAMGYWVDSWLQLGPKLGSNMAQREHVWTQIGLNVRNLVLCGGICRGSWAVGGGYFHKIVRSPTFGGPKQGQDIS